MLIKSKSDILSSEITDLALYESRREFLKSSSAFAASLLLPGLAQAEVLDKAATPALPDQAQLTPTSREYVTNYTNYYEFTTNKQDATTLAQPLQIKPWSVEIAGAAEKTGTFNLEDLLKNQVLQERIYRFRCVEAWSMVVPWLGFPLADLLKSFNPTSKARFVEFTTLYKPDVMVGQKTAMLAWPYVEGLRMDEAMHPLTLLATGMYGAELPKQNGAPLRLVVPWKYGFKSIKAIVRIRFSETMPATAWAVSGPNEYGFYANVNPEVDHPRWSQRRERVLGSGIFTPKRDTEKFNGYGEQVAGMYAGMDLTKFF